MTIHVTPTGIAIGERHKNQRRELTADELLLQRAILTPMPLPGGKRRPARTRRELFLLGLYSQWL